MGKEDRKARRKLEENMAKYRWRYLDREILRALRKRLKKKKIIIIIPRITGVL
jgi:type IV secretory pathway VirD2 relaxase